MIAQVPGVSPGLSLARRRLAIRFAALRWEVIGIGLVGLAVLLALSVTLAASMRGQAAATPTVSMPIQPAKAAALIDATSGEQALELRATGQAAEQINAALPLGAGPVQAAAAFAAPTGGTAYDRALTCLTQAVYYEAGFEPPSGRRAVAQVILNRMRHPAYPKSICGVVYQRNATPICQFTFVCDGALNRAAAAGPWSESRTVATAAPNGYVEASVGQATHYHATYVAPYWAPKLHKISQIGAHIFYRWPGSWGQRGAFTGRYIGEPSDPNALRPTLRPAAAPAQRSWVLPVVALGLIALAAVYFTRESTPTQPSPSALPTAGTATESADPTASPPASAKSTTTSTSTALGATAPPLPSASAAPARAVTSALSADPDPKMATSAVGPAGPGVKADDMQQALPQLLERATAARRSGDTARAKALLDRALVVNPGNTEAYAGLGEIARAQGDLAAAKGAFQRAVATSPHYSPALIGLADTLWELGERNAAQGHYREMLTYMSAPPERVKQRANVVVPITSLPTAAPAASASAATSD